MELTLEQAERLFAIIGATNDETVPDSWALYRGLKQALPVARKFKVFARRAQDDGGISIGLIPR